MAAACGGSTEPVGNAGTSSSSGGSSGGSSSGSTSGSAASSSSGGASSSGGSSSSSSGTVEVFDANLCSPTAGYEMMVGLTLADSVDSLEIRDQLDGDLSAPFTSRGVVGTPCATAGAKAKCEADLAAFRSPGFPLEPSHGGLVPAMHRYGVTTKKDVIAALDTPAALASALLPIDNAKDAALLVTAKGDVYVACDGNNAVKTATGFDIKVRWGTSCGAGTKETDRVYSVTTGGAVTLKSETLFREGDPGCVAGRRPGGLVAQRSGDCADPVGRFFAEAAHLEAASIYAFERLAGELLDLGAPDELVEAAYASREDEVRHTRMTSKMARRFGGVPLEPQVAELPARSKLAIALENATEGCVRETWGALVAHRQAASARDESIRCMMQVIAEDETRHAALAWDVAAWLEPQLTADERELVNDARRRALAELRRELEVDAGSELRARAGMPDARTALAMLDALDQRFLAVA
ncbi:MAG: ferritin-like domain-containing protein [Labilithrix sp.]